MEQVQDSQDDWRTRVARIAVDCLLMGARQVPIGAYANPFMIRSMRAGQEFDVVDERTEARQVALLIGTYVQRPFEAAWCHLCGPGEAEMTAAIAGLLGQMPDRMMTQTLNAAAKARADRARQVWWMTHGVRACMALDLSHGCEP